MHLARHREQHSIEQTRSTKVLSAPTGPLLMQPAELFQDESFETTTTLKQEKYCRSCWRKDLHFRVSYSPIVFGFLLVATCGLILIIRPSRCVCCGTMRIN